MENFEKWLGPLAPYKTIVLSFGIAGALVLVILLLGAGEGTIPIVEPDPIAAGTTITSPDGLTEVVTDDSEHNPDVPPIECFSIITQDDIDEALDAWDRPDGPLSTFGFSGGETCSERGQDDEKTFIRLEPGHPSDFEPDAVFLGSGPQPISNVGDAAVWFSGSGADAHAGLLAVGQETPLGALHFRIALGRPELDDAERLAIVTELARTVLPRFPGTPPAPPKPVFDLCELVTDSETEVVLDVYRDSRLGALDEVKALGTLSDLVDLSEDGESKCTKLILTEIYIEVQQGSTSDFEVGASFEGITGEAVSDLGDEAVWFANIPYQGSFSAPHQRGVLSVRLGDATFRIVTALPDMAPGDQLEIARDLAANAVLRISRGFDPNREPEVVTFDEEPVDISNEGLVTLLETRVESGEWTRGEGLVALLDWMANGTPGAVPDDMLDRSGTGVIWAAKAYLDGDETEHSEEIAALLDQLILTNEELEEMTSTDEPSADRSLLVSLVPLAQEQPSDPCEYYWGINGPCLDSVNLPDSDLDAGKYKLWVHLDENSKWSSGQVDIAKQALVDSATKFEELGSMPPTHLVLAPKGEYDTYTDYDVASGDCHVYVGSQLSAHKQKTIEQALARDIAFCLIYFDFFLQVHGNQNPTWWLVSGLAEYLGGVAYDDNNLEHKTRPHELAQSELSTTVVDRSWTNWILFEHLSPLFEPSGVVAMVRGFPESGDLVAALAAEPGMPAMYHMLNEALTDASVGDLGGGTVPYEPQAWELNLSGPTDVPFTVPQFGVRRLHIKVPPLQYACQVGVFTQGELEFSWRSGAPGGNQGDSWQGLPETLEGESVVVVTAVEPGAHFTLEVADVGDNPDCEDEEEPAADEPDECNVICEGTRYIFKHISGDEAP